MKDKIDGRKKRKTNPSKKYVDYICKLFNDAYDDRIEDSKLQGADWKSGGKKADHMSLERFRKMLKADYDIELSTAKIRKILITGNCWTTTRSRQIKKKFDELGSVRKVANELKVSAAFVTMNLPYEKVVYDLKDKSGNAKRVERWRQNHKDKINDSL